MEEKRKPAYVYFGDPKGDPRKDNRMFLKCTSLRKETEKVLEFVEAAIENGALVIQINAPGRSGKDDAAELYSDASIDEKALKDFKKKKSKWRLF